MSIMQDANIQASNLHHLQGGNQFIQIGLWRMGNYDYHHFCFTHKSGYTAVIYRSDGTIHPGPRTDLNLWERQKLNRPEGVVFGNGFLQFGETWRLAQINPQHLSLSNISGKTAVIWRCDGTIHRGPRSDLSGWQLHGKEGKGIKYSNNVLQIGYWRIGQCDESHMSIGTTMTSEIYRGDGTMHSGPRFDYNLCRNEF